MVDLIQESQLVGKHKQLRVRLPRTPLGFFMKGNEMVTKAYLEIKLAEVQQFNQELHAELKQMGEEMERLESRCAEMRQRAEDAEKQIHKLVCERDEFSRKSAELTNTTDNLTGELDRQKRRVYELEGLLAHIASLCEHRSRVSHSVMLFECDADGNRLIVPEEVRFLREIAEICNDNEIPF